MVSVDGLAVEFGGTTLFSDISFQINEKDRIALMGKNGAGKSTLLKILAGVRQPTRGKISAPKDSVIAYLPQHLMTEDGRTVFQEAAQAFAHLHEMETIAQQVVQEQGYSYPVKAELVTMPFTERTYEDLTMPAGTYEAIRITIGAAAGQNWWCVTYPPLCIPVAEDVAVQDEQAKAYFSDAEQDVLYHPERYRIKWKLAEWFKKWTTSEQTDHTTSHIADLRTFF